MNFKSWILVGALLAPVPALAHNCPNLMSQIDEMLAGKPDLDEETLIDEELHKNVKVLRAEGQALHESGQHAESVDRLQRALKLLEEET